MQSELTKKLKVTLIAAIDENRVLGKDNQLIWHLPEAVSYTHLTLPTSDLV